MITAEEVKKVAKLARIRMKEEDSGYFSQQIQQIMNMINVLEEVNCDNVAPLSSVNDSFAVMRSDTQETWNTLDDLFANVQGRKKELAKSIKCFTVPKVIE